MHANAKGRKLKNMCTMSMGKIFGAQGYVVMHMVMVACMRYENRSMITCNWLSYINVDNNVACSLEKVRLI